MRFDHIGGLDMVWRALGSGHVLVAPPAEITPDTVAAAIERHAVEVMPAPRSTVVSGSESTYTGMRVALVMRSAKPVPPPVLDAEPAPATEAAAVPPAAPPSEPVPPQTTVSDDELQALDLSLRMADFVDLTAERKSEDKPAQVSKAPISNKPASKTEGGELRKPQISESGKPESVELPKQEKGQPALPGVEAPASHPVIEKTDAQGTPHERADGEYRKAITLVNQGRVDDALAGLRNALRLEPLHQTARQLLVKLLLEAKRSEEAEQALSEGVQRQPAQLAWAMTLARLQVDRGDLASAWQTLNHSQPAAGGNADYQGFSGHVLQRLGRHKEAVERYLAAARLAPDDGRWWLGLGLSLESDGRTGEAREAFEHARKGGNLSAELLALIEQKLK